MMRRYLPFALLALAACSQGTESEDQAAASGSAGTPSAATPPSPAPTIPPRVSRYMPLDSCAVVRDERTEMPYREVKCGGPAGWALRIGDSDARQTLAVIAPGGGETPLDLSGYRVERSTPSSGLPNGAVPSANPSSPIR